MISSLLRPNQSQRKKRRGSRSEPSYFQRDAPFQGGVFETRSFQHPDDRQRPSDSYHDEDEDAAASDEDGDGQDIEYDEITPLLPIFSAAHLGTFEARLDLQDVSYRCVLNKLQMLYLCTTSHTRYDS